MTTKPTLTVRLPQGFTGDDEAFVTETLNESGFAVAIGDIDPHEYGDIQTVALTIGIISGTLTIGQVAVDLVKWIKTKMFRYKPAKYRVEIFLKVRNSRIEYLIPRDIEDASPLLAIESDLQRSLADKVGRKLWEDGQWLYDTELLSHRRNRKVQPNPNALEPDVFGGDGNADLDPDSDTDCNR